MSSPPKTATAWSVRQASIVDVEGMARSLARVFCDDPVWRWFMPDDATRTQRLQRMFVTLTRNVYLRHGEVCYTTDAYEGALLSAPPGHAKMSIGDVVRILPGWTKAIGWRELRRTHRGVQSFEKVHPREPHYYVPFAGVVPESQGRGLGTALMRPILEKCDGERVPGYLEATNTGSRRCWERAGFHTRAEERLPGGGPPFWTMWRAPAS